MKIGMQINRFTWKGEPKTIRDILTKIAITAEKEGFYSLWVMDHFFQIHFVGEPQEPMLEAYATLGFLAGITKRVKLGTMVTGVIYRNPALLIKAVTTLDVLSQGRAYLGIGAAWNEEESKGLGFEFPPLKVRFEMLEETLEIAYNMWSKEPKPFGGQRFHQDNPINSPNAISKPHPPILIGGGGEKKTLRLVAEYGNATNLFNSPELEHKLQVLKEHCAKVGRDYNSIEKTVLTHPQIEDGKINTGKFIKDCERLSKLGITHVITSFRNVEEIEPIKVFGKKVIPEIAGL